MRGSRTLPDHARDSFSSLRKPQIPSPGNRRRLRPTIPRFLRARVRDAQVWSEAAEIPEPDELGTSSNRAVIGRLQFATRRWLATHQKV